MADMATRISSLEKSLAEAQKVSTKKSVGLNSKVPAQSAVTARSGSSHSVTSLESPARTHRDRVSSLDGGSRNNLDLTVPIRLEPSPGRSGEDVLVQRGSSSHYFNEILTSRVIEQVRRHLRASGSILTRKQEQNIESVLIPSQKELTEHIPSPFSAMGVLSSRSMSPTSFHPPKDVAIKLWNIYLNSVDGSTGLKVLHLPTDEVKVYSVINDPTATPPEYLALNFAIYFAAVVAVDTVESEALLGQDRTVALVRLRAGLEQSFAHCDFLDNPTMTGLHAMAIYLSALRICNRGKGIWILDGLAIRIAQSLGLHRDGKRLGLSPFQSEMRRRLWWHLINRETRAGEDYGLESTNSLLLSSDVDLPSNIYDTDINPDMQHPPQARTEWTTMSFSLILIDISKTMQRLAGIAEASSPSSPPSETVRAQIMRDTKARAEAWLAKCNAVVPEHRRALRCTQFLLRKHDFVTRLQWILLRGTAITGFATEQNLTEALQIVDSQLFMEDDLLLQFSWARKAYPQYHVTLYMLWHLCIKPQGPNTDRAWEAVEKVLCRDLQDLSSLGYGSKSSVLVALKAKAMSIREKILKPDTSHNSNDVSSRLAEEPREGETVPYTDGNDFGLEGNVDDWLDWTTFSQGFQLNSPSVF